MKPGWKTSEFWLTLGQQALGGAVAAGAASDHWTARLVGAVMAAVAHWRYNDGRAAQKKEQAKHKTNADAFGAQPIGGGR